jgi:hypothetical protein
MAAGAVGVAMEVIVSWSAIVDLLSFSISNIKGVSSNLRCLSELTAGRLPFQEGTVCFNPSEKQVDHYSGKIWVFSERR